jgi:hypothetical protein
MKIFCALLFVLSIVAARADSTNLPAPRLALPSVPSSLTPTNAASSPEVNGDQWSLSGTVRQPDLTEMLTVEKPNELRLGKVTLSGSVVEVWKTRKPMQLINPWAPREYGESQDNAAFNVINNQVTGWKLFSIEF